MKKLILTLIALCILNCFSLKAQNLIALQHNNTPSFYQQVDDAITNSQNGDTIYIPGGVWNINHSINKRLCIIGVGHNPDSNTATFSTTLNGNITLAAGASYGSIKGVCLNGTIDGTQYPTNFYVISRCYIKNNIELYQTDSNFVFIENIIAGVLNGNSPTNCSFFNNIFSGYFNVQYANCFFKNNIFMSDVRGQYSLYQNNIFINTDVSGCSNSTFKNNIFMQYIDFPYGTNTGMNNIVAQPQNSIFVNVNQSSNAFSYSYDYHLQSNSPGKNAGTDGKDIGIYGGQYPWKDGSLPSNPHIMFNYISDTVNSNGELPVNIKVEAQDN